VAQSSRLGFFSSSSSSSSRWLGAASGAVLLSVGFSLLADAAAVHADDTPRFVKGRENTPQYRNKKSLSTRADAQGYVHWTNEEGQACFLVAIPTISCMKCVNKITKHMLAHADVEHAVISLATKAAVVVQKSSQQLTPTVLDAHLRAIGHKAAPVDRKVVVEGIMDADSADPSKTNTRDYEVFGRAFGECGDCDNMLRVSPCSEEGWQFMRCVVNPPFKDGLSIAARFEAKEDAEVAKEIQRVVDECQRHFMTAHKCASENNLFRAE
jgi:hypothetical protein